MLVRLLAFVAITQMSIAAAHAQAPPPAPADFVVVGSLDVVIDGVNGGDQPTTSDPVIVAGWTFECRSGLQPKTQRLGEIHAFYKSIDKPAEDPVEVKASLLLTVARPDVAAVYQPYCPAVGANVGFVAVIPPPPAFGTWTLQLVVSATDSADRVATWTGLRTIHMLPE